MKEAKSIQELKNLLPETNKVHGFIPTMGALHEGHFSLIRQAKKECDFVSVSIYLNPTQFNNVEDLDKYPSDIKKDLNSLKDLDVDLVFLPDYKSLYPDNYRFKINENTFSKELCGKHRPGHFDGVLTVVMKLFQLLRPNKAYFGEKDYQQLYLIKDMTKAFFLPIEVIGLPTIRENDGLAMSSRNKRLSPQAREKANLISKLLKENISSKKMRQELEREGFMVDYIEDHFGRRFIAASLEGIRLIDNRRLNEK